MAKKNLSLAGGILLLISVFLPTLFVYFHVDYFGVESTMMAFYWMFGYTYATMSAQGYGQSVSASATHFDLDIIGVVCMAIIILGAILALVTASKSNSKMPLVGGLLGIVGMIIFLGSFYADVSSVHYVSEVAVGVVAPFIGAWLCIIGGIIAIIGGASN